jgi:hypothetical protein
MKVQNIFRMKTILIGLGAALLLAGSVHAQEIENTVWDEGSNVAPFAQTALTPTTNNLQPAPAEAPTMSLAAMTTAPLITQEASVSQWTPVEGWLFASLLVCIALVAVYALAEAKRANRNIEARAVRLNNGAALY